MPGHVSARAAISVALVAVPWAATDAERGLGLGTAVLTFSVRSTATARARSQAVPPVSAITAAVVSSPDVLKTALTVLPTATATTTAVTNAK